MFNIIDMVEQLKIPAENIINCVNSNKGLLICFAENPGIERER